MLFVHFDYMRGEIDMNDEWIISNLANGHKTCDNLAKEATQIFEVVSILEKQYNLICERFPVMELSTTVFLVKIYGEEITIGWDNWSGIFIMADTNNGDEIIEQIYNYLKSINN